MSKKVIYTCDKCKKEFDDSNKDAVKIWIRIDGKNISKIEEYHYCSEECYLNRFEG